MTVQPVVLWAAVGAWAVLFGPPGLPSRGLIPTSGYEMAVAATVVGSSLLSCAVVVSTARSLLQQPSTLRSIAGATGSVGLFCALVGMLFYLEGLESRLIWSMSQNAFVDSGVASGKLERFYDLPNRKSGRVAASMAYRELGLRIGYVGEDGRPIIFEPNAEDEQSRSTIRELRRDALPQRDRIERHADFLRTAAIIHLASLPIVALAYLLHRRRQAPRAP